MSLRKKQNVQLFIFGTLSVISNSSYALACPPGYYPIGGDHVGWHSCAPMDGGIINESENDKPAGEQRSEERWEDPTVPLPLPMGRWGKLFPRGGEGNVTARGPDIKEVERSTTENCSESVSNCKIYYSACSLVSN